MTAGATTGKRIKAVKEKKPAIIKERGEPRFVILEWEDYTKLKDAADDVEDTVRLLDALADPANQKRIPLALVRRKLGLS